jgi:hypothetical protein
MLTVIRNIRALTGNLQFGNELINLANATSYNNGSLEG